MSCPFRRAYWEPSRFLQSSAAAPWARTSKSRTRPASAAIPRRRFPTTTATPGVAAATPSVLSQAADIGGDWWTAFHSPVLNALIDQSLKNNSDLKAAEATLRQAHENATAQKGAFYPQVCGQFAASHQEQPAAPWRRCPTTIPSQYDLFTPQLNISYAPDIWGLTRRTVESYEAQSRCGALSDARHLHHPGQQCDRHGGGAKPPPRPRSTPPTA